VSTLLRSKFQIDRENVAPALTDLQNWNESWRDVSDEYYDIKAASTLEDALHHVGFDVVEDQDGNVTAIQQHNDVDTDWHEAAMSSIAEWVWVGSFMLFHSDEEELYCWSYPGDSKFVCHADGVVVFPHQVQEVTDRLVKNNPWV
jgi:hypothetical protein